MPKLSLTRSIHIDVPVETAYASVRDFRQWPAWSPWLITDPECQVRYAEDGEEYSWEGEVAGAGRMEMEGEEQGKLIYYQLTFLKPWKSKASVRFEFSDDAGGTKVTWSMHSALPFFMFFMKKLMLAMIGMDYERGLVMLKDFLETGGVPSALAFEGCHQVNGFHYIAVRRECGIKDIEAHMEKDLKQVLFYVDEHGVKKAGDPFTLYDEWDPVKGKVAYTTGVAVKTVPAHLPDGYVTGDLDSCRAYVVRHTGHYKHLGNAWAGGMMHGRAKKFPQCQKQKPFEFYQSRPPHVDPNETVTLVYLPCK